jgi:hypothetical protein
MTAACIEAKRRELYVSTPGFFQIEEDLTSFETSVYLALAQTLVRNVRSFSAVGLVSRARSERLSGIFQARFNLSRSLTPQHWWQLRSASPSIHWESPRRQ